MEGKEEKERKREGKEEKEKKKGKKERKTEKERNGEREKIEAKTIVQNYFFLLLLFRSCTRSIIFDST